MRTIENIVFTFDELSDMLNQKALYVNREINVDYLNGMILFMTIL
jgi:hypothetical protein